MFMHRKQMKHPGGSLEIDRSPREQKVRVQSEPVSYITKIAPDGALHIQMYMLVNLHRIMLSFICTDTGISFFYH